MAELYPHELLIALIKDQLALPSSLSIGILDICVSLLTLLVARICLFLIDIGKITDTNIIVNGLNGLLVVICLVYFLMVHGAMSITTWRE